MKNKAKSSTVKRFYLATAKIAISLSMAAVAFLLTIGAPASAVLAFLKLAQVGLPTTWSWGSITSPVWGSAAVALICFSCAVFADGMNKKLK